MDVVKFVKSVNRLCKNQSGGAIHVRRVTTGGQLYDSRAYISGAVATACVLNPESLNLRQSIAYVEEVSE